MRDFFDEVIDRNFPADNELEIMLDLVAIQIKFSVLNYLYGFFSLFLKYFEDTAKANHIKLPHVDPLLKGTTKVGTIQFIEIFKVYAYVLGLLNKDKVKKVLHIADYFEDKRLFEGYFKETMTRTFGLIG